MIIVFNFEIRYTKRFCDKKRKSLKQRNFDFFLTLKWDGLKKPFKVADTRLALTNSK